MHSNWTQVSKVPQSYLKTIGFGKLKGKSDISPQWRIKAMTEVYGLCGVGWVHNLVNQWTETASNGEVLAFVEVSVKIKVDGEWSLPFTGLGGNKIEELAKGNLKPNDEGYKMAYTDALGTALKCIGVASEIYEGNFDGSKYNKSEDATQKPKKEYTLKDIEKLNGLALKGDMDGLKKLSSEFDFDKGVRTHALNLYNECKENQKGSK